MDSQDGKVTLKVEADYESPTTMQIVSFLRFTEYSEDQESLAELVQEAKEDYEGPVPTCFADYSIGAISLKNEVKVHQQLIKEFKQCSDDYPLSLDWYQKTSLNQTEQKCKDWRLKVQSVCEFFISSSTFAIEVLNRNYTDAQKHAKSVPSGLRSLENYLEYIVLPLIEEEATE